MTNAPLDQIDIWHVSFLSFEPYFSYYLTLLTHEEQQRARRYRCSESHRQFVISRALLRILLENYLHIPAREIELKINQYGKPHIQPSYPEKSIHFNLSHSADEGFFAFCRTASVGIDVERIRNDISVLSLAQSCFSPSEVEALLALPEMDRPTAFFIGWTRKESYIKGHGQGVSMALDGFDVSLAEDATDILYASRHDPSSMDRWTISNLRTGAGFVGALAVESKSFKVAYHDCSALDGIHRNERRMQPK